VQSLCGKAIYLSHGHLQMIADVKDVIDIYLKNAQINKKNINVAQMPRIAGGKDIRLLALDLFNENGDLSTDFHFNNRMTMRFKFKILNNLHSYFAIEWTICTTDGIKVAYGSSSPQNKFLFAPTDSEGCIECILPNLPLTVGKYLINCLISLPHQKRIDEVEAAAHFNVVTCDVYDTGFNIDYRLSLITIPARWSILNGAKAL